MCRLIHFGHYFSVHIEEIPDEEGSVSKACKYMTLLEKKTSVGWNSVLKPVFIIYRISEITFSLFLFVFLLIIAEY